MKYLMVGWLACMVSAGGFAADADGEVTLKSLVQLTAKEITFRASTGKAMITLSGTTTELPPGAKLTFEIQYYYTCVGRAIGSVEVDSTFKNVKLSPSLQVPQSDPPVFKPITLAPGKGYEIRCYINVDDQVPTLKKKVKALQSKHQAPLLLEFALGSEAEQKKARTDTVKFIKDLIKEAIGLNNKLADAVKAATEKTDYVKIGKLDTEKWRAFMDNDLRKGVIAVQKKYDAWIKKHEVYKFRYASGHYFMQDFLNVLGYRTILESRDVYKAFKEKLAQEDVSKPAGMNMKTRFSIKTSKKARQAMIDAYKKVVDTKGFDVLPKKKAPPKKNPSTPAKKPAEKGGKPGKTTGK